MKPIKPIYAFFLGTGIASVVGAASGAAIFLALKSEPQVADKTPAPEKPKVEAAAPAPAPARDPCENQAWPHFDRSCLERKAEQRAIRNVGTDNPVKPAEASEPVPPVQAAVAPVPAAPAQPAPVQQAATPTPAPQQPTPPAPQQVATPAPMPVTTGAA